MKKLFLCAAVAVFGLSSVFAQNFNVGLSAALPMGDGGDVSSFGVALDANYLFEVSDKFDVGVASGFQHFFGSSEDVTVLGTTVTTEFDDTSFLPIAAAARFNASEEFTIGVDLGYAVGISPDGNDGGIYYAPKVQYSFSEQLSVVAAYRGVSIGGDSETITVAGVTTEIESPDFNFSSITIGVEYKL